MRRISSIQYLFRRNVAIATLLGLLTICCKSTPKIESMHTNALIHEASPYLLQHAHNPVDWLPWGDAAFEKARELDRPVFLSIGYAACHWCHVMERESFENDTIAAFLNEHFVSIKVDREERPDIDHYYMQAVQRIVGGGGWPLSVFLTPDRKPFFGGTYWPPDTRYGRPGFIQVLKSVQEMWTTRRDELMTSAESLHEVLAQGARTPEAAGELVPELFVNVVRQSEQRYDSIYGGFGEAPKFPQAMELATLLREYQRTGNVQAREMVEQTLDWMARGGIYDQVGGGFARYSTDARWLVPHFEKMLYDNALLIPLYLDASLAFARDDFRQVAVECLEWALREMEVVEGGFASSLDADSEGEEGKFYVWTPNQVISVLGQERGSRFCEIHDISSGGNFERGHSIANLPQTIGAWATRLGVDSIALAQELRLDRDTLLTAREMRVRPGRDDKVLTDWNGLFLSALVRGFAVVGDDRYLEAAVRLAERLYRPFEQDHELVHSFLGDRTLTAPLLLDYAAFGNGLLDLFLATGDRRWFEGSAAIAERMHELFRNEDGGLYYLGAESVAGTRLVDVYDSALPSGNSMAGNLLAKLFYITGEDTYRQRAESQVTPIAGLLERAAPSFGQAWLTADLLVHPPAQLVLIGDPVRQLWGVAQENYLPRQLTLWIGDPQGMDVAEDSPLASLVRGKVQVDNRATAYLCRDFVCERPVVSVHELRQTMKQAARVPAP